MNAENHGLFSTAIELPDLRRLWRKVHWSIRMAIVGGMLVAGGKFCSLATSVLQDLKGADLSIRISCPHI